MRFTGANQDKMGLFEFADKGVIFLDEIGDMPLGTQAKPAAHAAESGSAARGVPHTAPHRRSRDWRPRTAICARPCAAKTFREDLFYRLSMVEIQVPSLEERKEDIPLLTSYFLEKFATQFSKQICGFTQRAQIILARHTWPGNIRELENVVGHASMMVMGDMIDVADLPDYLRCPARQASASGLVPVAEHPGDSGDSFDEHEKRLVRDGAGPVRGRQSIEGRGVNCAYIGRDALRYKMKKHGMPSIAWLRNAWLSNACLGRAAALPLIQQTHHFLPQLRQRDRLAHIAVEAGRERSRAIALHRAGRKRHDRHCAQNRCSWPAVAPVRRIRPDGACEGPE